VVGRAVERDDDRGRLHETEIIMILIMMIITITTITIIVPRFQSGD
jgi:hypothetical protein